MSEIYQNIDISIFCLLKKYYHRDIFWAKKDGSDDIFYDISDFYVFM